MDKKEKTKLRIELGKILDEYCRGCIHICNTPFCHVGCPYGHRLAEIGMLISSKTTVTKPEPKPKIIVENKGEAKVPRKTLSKELYLGWKAEGLSKRSMAARFKVSEPTLNKYIKIWEQDENQKADHVETPPVLDSDMTVEELKEVALEVAAVHTPEISLKKPIPKLEEAIKQFQKEVEVEKEKTTDLGIPVHPVMDIPPVEEYMWEINPADHNARIEIHYQADLPPEKPEEPEDKLNPKPKDDKSWLEFVEFIEFWFYGMVVILSFLAAVKIDLSKGWTAFSVPLFACIEAALWVYVIPFILRLRISLEGRN